MSPGTPSWRKRAATSISCKRSFRAAARRPRHHLNRISQDTGKVFLDEMQIADQQFRGFEKVRIIACGTSWHAALAGKFMIERLAPSPSKWTTAASFAIAIPFSIPRR